MAGLVHSYWPILAVLLYLMVTVVLGVLASLHKRSIELHERIRRSHRIRQDYLDDLEDRRAGIVED